MLVELAARLESEEVIAERYGYNKHEMANLKRQSWFKEAQKEASALIETQFPFQKRMAVLAESLTLHLYEKTLETDSMPAKIEATKLFTKLADLEPKANQGSGKEGFSIQIVIPQIQDGNHKVINLNAEPAKIPAQKSIDNSDLFTVDDLFEDKI